MVETATCRNVTQTFIFGQNTTCNTTPDNSVPLNTMKANFQSTFTVVEGLVTDPFLATKGMYYLLKDSVEQNFLWVRQSDYAIVYWQQFHTDIGEILVLQFPNGVVQGSGVSFYDFKIFNCDKP